MVLLLGNVGAVVLFVAIVAATNVSWSRVDDAYGDGSIAPEPGLVVNGSVVTNVYPYDAQGRPIVGVQLVDQDGRRLAVEKGYDSSLVPWTNGRQQMYSVFPMPSRDIDAETGEASGTPQIRSPFASLPPVTLEGFLASVLTNPEPEADPSPTAGPTPTPSPAAR